MRKILATIMMALCVTSVQAATEPSEILACVFANAPTGPTVSEVTVTTQDPASDASRTLSGKFYVARSAGDGQDDQLWAMLRVSQPAYLHGAAYLVREVGDALGDEMFVYLPAVGRVRQITGSFANKPLLGTTFSYFDFKQIWNAFGDLIPVALAKSAEINGREAYRLHLHTHPDTRISYSTIALWVDQQTCVAVRADFMRDGEVLKRMTVPKGALVQVNGRWYPDRIRMIDLINNLESVMRIENVKSFDDPAASLFDPDSFYQSP